jgi:hypothetical protein
MTTSPRVITAPIAQVPATIRSGTVVYSTGERASTPSTVMVGRARALDAGTHRASIVHRSTISGSRAALSTTVVPLARTAAITRFSVAPTDGKSSQIEVPVSRGAVATRKPCSLDDRRAEPLQAGDVHVEPAGADRVASGQRHLGEPQRATSGPSTLIEARILRTRS